MVAEDQNLWIFGGSNGERTLDDLWRFSLAERKW
jgi:hypothetical protein